MMMVHGDVSSDVALGTFAAVVWRSVEGMLTFSAWHKWATKKEAWIDLCMFPYNNLVVYPVSDCILIFSRKVCPSQQSPHQTAQHSLEFVTETSKQLFLTINLSNWPEDAVDNEVDAAVDSDEQVVSLSELVISFPNMLKYKTD